MNLTAEDLKMFARLGVGPDLLEAANIARVNDATARRDCKLVGPGDMSGLAFPYFKPGSDREVMSWCRVRRDNPEIGEDGRPQRKYLAPPSSEGVRPIPYFPPGAQELIADRTTPAILIESEKATLALIAWSERTGRKLLPIGLGGAWGWSRVVGTKEIKGETVEIHGLDSDLAAVCRDRKTFILFDANAATNPDVQKARQRLAAELRNIGAVVHVLDLPTLPGINGPDDYLASAGDQAFADLFDDQKVGAAILDDVAAFIKRYMVLTDAQVTAIALWISHTHAIDACQFTPYLAITSAEKRCGKSRLLEILEYLVREPWMTSGATAPALFRRIDAKRPCLLLDEIDALVKGSPEMAEAVRGVLNAGNKKGATISRCVGKGTEMLVKDFAAFCPKAVSGIGSLPDTVRDRSLPIRLQRKLSVEQVARLRARLVKPEAGPLRERLKNWVEAQVPQLEDARPEMPEQLDDRQQDGAEILFSIALAAGHGWPDRCRKALLELFRSVDVGDDSARLRLLADLRTIFTDFPLADAFSTSELLEKLKEIETSPWSDWSKGRGLTPKGLSDLLKPYGIYPGQFQEKGMRNRGYRRTDFEDAWGRYLPIPLTPGNNLCTRAESSIHAVAEAKNNPSTEPQVHGLKSEVSANKDAGAAHVHGLNPGYEGSAVETRSESGAISASPSPDPTPLAETVAALRQRFHYSEKQPATGVIPCPPEVLAAIPPDGPGYSWNLDGTKKETTEATISPDLEAESEAIRRHFENQENIWRANPHAPPIMPFLAATQIEADESQIFHGKPPDLRVGRSGDQGLYFDAEQKRHARYRRKK